MNEPARVKAVPAKPLKTNPLLKRLISYALLALVFFLLGFLPLWAHARTTAGRLTQAEQQLRRAQLQNTLGASVIDAQRGEYDQALRAASSFFTELRAEIDRGDASAFSGAEQAALLPLFRERDDLITLLARGDPAAVARLSDLYQSYLTQFSGKSTTGLKPVHSASAVALPSKVRILVKPQRPGGRGLG